MSLLKSQKSYINYWGCDLGILFFSFETIKTIIGIKVGTSNQKMVNTGGDERFEKFKTSSKFKPVQRNKKSKVKIDKRFKSMLQKVCSFFALRQSN